MNIEYLQMEFGNNTIQNYLIAFGIFFLSLLVLQIIKSIILSRLKALAKKTENYWDDVFIDTLHSLGWPFYFIIALYAAIQPLNLIDFLANFIDAATLIVVTYYVVISLQRILEFALLELLGEHQEEGEARLDSTIANFIKNALRAALWIGAGIVILQNLGYEVGALLGSLGIAGLAIAFALQNVLTDIFAFFSIYFDKPFKKGDFVIVGNDMGTIEHIGIKSTRVCTLEGQELVVSNTELTQARVNNYKPMEERRIVFKFGVLYETPLAKLKKIPEMVQKIIEKEEDVRFDRAHFTDFGDFSLNFEVVYYVKTQDYLVYRNVQQAINLGIMEVFEKERIEFAYPTQVVYVNK